MGFPSDLPERVPDQHTQREGLSDITARSECVCVLCVGVGVGAKEWLGLGVSASAWLLLELNVKSGSPNPPARRGFPRIAPI